MEPTTKAFQALAGAVRDVTGNAAGFSLRALQIIDIKAGFDAHPCQFRALLQQETQRVEPAAAPPRTAPEAPAEGRSAGTGRQDRDPEPAADEPDGVAAGGKSSPQDGKPSPAGETATRAEPEGRDRDNGGPGNGTKPVQAGNPAADQVGDLPDEGTMDAGLNDEEAIAAASVEDAALEIVADPGLEAEQATGGMTTESPSRAPAPVQQAEDSEIAGSGGASPAALGENPEIGATLEPSAEAMEVDAEAAVTQVPAAAANAGTAPADRARTQVAQNMERNPEAAADGLRRAQEALAQAGARPPAGDPATDRGGEGEASARTLSRGPQVAVPDPARPGQAVAQELRAPEVPVRGQEPAAAQAPAPRMAPTAEMMAQIRVPAAAAQKAEQALAARVTGEAVEARASGSSTATVATGGVTAGQAAGTQVSDAARAALQHARASYNRPGWDIATAQRVAQLAARGVQSAEIQVDPPELGPVKVVIQVNNDQQTSVSFSSPNAGVREALEMTAQRLREALAEAGLDLADVDVSDQSPQERETAGEDGEQGPQSLHAAAPGETGGEAESDLEATVTVRDSDSLVDHYV